MKTEWKPIYNSTFRAYGIYRLVDNSVADIPANREYHESGAIFADQSTALRVAKELNEAEDNG